MNFEKAEEVENATEGITTEYAREKYGKTERKPKD